MNASHEPTTEPVMNLTKSKRLWPAVVMGAAITGIGLSALFLGVSMKYQNTLMPGVSINDLNVGGLTQAQAIDEINTNVVARQSWKVVVNEDTILPTATDLGVTYPTEQVVARAYSFGHEANWWTRLVSTIKAPFTKQASEVKPVADTNKINSYSDTIVAKYLKEPVSASLTYANGQVSVSQATVGQAIDSAKLRSDFSASVGILSTNTITARVAVVAPAVSNDAMTAWRDRLTQLASIPVTVTTNDKSQALTVSQKLSWYSLQQNGSSYSIGLNKTAVADTLTAVSKKLAKLPVNEQVNADGSTAVAGTDGYNIDLNATNQQLTDKINGLVVTANAMVGGQEQSLPTAITLAAVITAVPMQKVLVQTIGTDQVAPAIDTDAKFIQVNLAQQKMYLFENRQVINVFAVSTGKRGYETPKGIHQIYAKSTRAWSHAYDLWLPYWNAITPDGGYGIHDLPEWPGGKKETAAHIGTPISHGCIRLATANAIYVYNWAPVGTAVVVQ